MKVMLKVLQLLIKASIIFMLFFIWLRFYITPMWKSICLALFFTIVLTLILSTVEKNKKTRIFLKAKEQQEAEQMFEFLTKNQDSNFFYNLAKQRNSNIENRKSFHIILTRDNHKIILYPHLKIQSLNKDEIIKIVSKLKKYKKDKLVICCNSYEKDINNLLSQFDFEILVLDKYSTYQYLFKEYDFYPNIPLKKEKSTKARLKEMIDYSFSRNKAKSYFFSAIFLLAISFTINTNLYYCIIASILTLFSLICIFKPTKKQEKISNVF